VQQHDGASQPRVAACLALDELGLFEIGMSLQGAKVAQIRTRKFGMGIAPKFASAPPKRTRTVFLFVQGGRVIQERRCCAGMQKRQLRCRRWRI
jgi:hypothetical protein